MSKANKGYRVLYGIGVTILVDRRCCMEPALPSQWWVGNLTIP